MSHLTRSGAILAGGQSTRFAGRDKSALLLDGHPILDHRQLRDSDRLLANVNTPADYAGLEALQGHKL